MWYIDTLYIKHIEEDIFIMTHIIISIQFVNTFFRAIVTLYCLNINGKIEWHLKHKRHC